jgi:hypothetical protein
MTRPSCLFYLYSGTSFDEELEPVPRFEWNAWRTPGSPDEVYWATDVGLGGHYIRVDREYTK